jgi:hypothetical protein
MQPVMACLSFMLKSAAANQRSHKGTEHMEWQRSCVCHRPPITDYHSSLSPLCFSWPIVWSSCVHLCSSQVQYIGQIAAWSAAPMPPLAAQKAQTTKFVV